MPFYFIFIYFDFCENGGTVILYIRKIESFLWEEIKALVKMYYEIPFMLLTSKN